MEFTIGLGIGMFIMWVITKRLRTEWKKEMKELRDFDAWKEWKNKN